MSKMRALQDFMTSVIRAAESVSTGESSTNFCVSKASEDDPAQIHTYISGDHAFVLTVLRSLIQNIIEGCEKDATSSGSYLKDLIKSLLTEESTRAILPQLSASIKMDPELRKILSNIVGSNPECPAEIDKSVIVLH